MTYQVFLRAVLCAATSCMIAIGSGCSDDETTKDQHDDTGDESQPLYLVHLRTFDADEITGLFVPTTSLDETPDYTKAIEEPSGGVLYAAEGIGTFVIGSGEEPTITRYEILKNGRLEAGESISFVNHGVTQLFASDSTVFVNAHKAYYLDPEQLQAIAFDPTEMEILGTSSLAELEREGFTAYTGRAVVRDDGVFLAAQWVDEENFDRAPRGSALVHIDPETDKVTITSDDRCTGMYVSMTSDNGDSYFFSDNTNAFARRGYGADHGVNDCALRLRAGETGFDPNWELDLTSRTDGRVTVPTLAAGDTKIWVRALDEDAVELPTPADFEALDTAQGWQWYLLDVASDAPAVRNDDRPLSSCGGLGMLVDGRAFTTDEAEDYASSTLIELTSDGFVSRAKLRGVVGNIARVR